MRSTDNNLSFGPFTDAVLKHSLRLCVAAGIFAIAKIPAAEQNALFVTLVSCAWTLAAMILTIRREPIGILLLLVFSGPAVIKVASMYASEPFHALQRIGLAIFPATFAAMAVLYSVGPARNRLIVGGTIALLALSAAI